MNNLDELYQQIILDASRERYGEGLLESPTGDSHQVNPTCGDEVTMQVRLSADGARLEEIGWDGHGCSISQASISIMTEMLEGASVSEARELFDTFKAMMESRGGHVSEEALDMLDDASAFQGVAKFPMRIKCALLGWMALYDAAGLAHADTTTDKSKEQ